MVAGLTEALGKSSLLSRGKDKKGRIYLMQLPLLYERKLSMAEHRKLRGMWEAQG